MEAIDNPSYFNLPPDGAHKRNKNGFFFFRRRSAFDGHSTLPATCKFNNKTSGLTRRNWTPSIDDTNLLVLGRPRPSDVAPLQYTDTRHSDLLHQDMVHCGAVNNPNFLTNQSTSYYNAATIPGNRFVNNGRRRHSIGSFLNRDKSNQSSNNNADKISQGNIMFKRKCRKITIDKACKMGDELDILMVYCAQSDAAALWVNYLVPCFQQIYREQNKSILRVKCIKLEDVLCENVPDVCKEAKLQIIILCPFFLQKLKFHSSNNPIHLFNENNVIAMMLGVNEIDLTTHHKNLMRGFEYWRRMIVKDQDATFVGDFLGVAMDILSRPWQLQEAIKSVEEISGFSLIPKKIKVGQNKLMALLKDPLTSDDNIQVYVDKNGNRLLITGVKRRNPYTLQFSVPGSCLQVSMLVNIHIEKNGKSIGHRVVKCESQMRELDQLLKSVVDPVQFLRQALGMNTNEQEHLDHMLLKSFQKNLPRDFNLFHNNLSNKVEACNEEYPTLLHFSAKFGLERLSWQLLECPGSEQAGRLRNSSHLTPAEIAEKSGHTKLANALRGHLQMTELSSVYTYLKASSERPTKENDANYVTPRPLSDTYLVPPAARPVSSNIMSTSFTSSSHTSPCYANFKPCNFILPLSPSTDTAIFANNYQVPRNGRACTPQTPSSPIETSMQGYLEMNTGSRRFGSNSSFNTNNDFSGSIEQFGKADYFDTSSLPTSDNTINSKQGSYSSREKLSPDDELLEIINDFKNNVFTISEVEKLVESWQNRNDVQQSFREKQEQLHKMREEYERIQHKMKEQMRRPTPLEKIRKFFSKGKSKGSQRGPENSKRPDSSISIQSSSSGSSGHLSGYSGCNYANASVINNNISVLEKNKNTNQIPNAENTEIPHPPNYLDLCAIADSNEYVQPECPKIYENPKSCSIKEEKEQKKEKIDKNIKLHKKIQEKKLKTQSMDRLTICEKEIIVDNKNDDKSKITKPNRKISQSCMELNVCEKPSAAIQKISVKSTDDVNLDVTDIKSISSNSNVSQCPENSEKNSSLDLSSLSSNSSYLSDENSNETKCCLELRILEESEKEVESNNEPMLHQSIQEPPDYVNIPSVGPSPPPLPPRCKYATVSS